MSEFDEVAIQIAQTPFAVSNEIKLELYGLYKVATASSLPKKPTVFQPRERAKWGAWERAHQSCVNSEDAKRQYIALAQSLLQTRKDSDGR